MKNKLFKNTLASLSRTKGRFVSIMSIIAIGCAFFSGVKASCPYMKESAYDYLENGKLADIHMKSTLGFTDDDFTEISSVESVETIVKGYSAELIIKGTDENRNVAVYSYNSEDDINRLKLIKGTLPKNANECVVDYLPSKASAFNIGDKITLSPDGEDDISEVLNNTEYTVVGLVQSPIYVTYDRGTATVGDGVMNAYMYIPEANFAYEAYTDLYIRAKELRDINCFSDEYEEKLEPVISQFENIGETRIEVRCNEIVSDAMEEINSEREKVDDAMAEYEKGEKAYNTAYEQYSSGLNDYNKMVEEYNQSQQQYEQGLTDLQTATDNLKRLEETCTTLDNILEEYSNGYTPTLSQTTVDKLNGIQEVYDLFEIDVQIKDVLAIYMITSKKDDPHAKEEARLTILETNNNVRKQCRYAADDINQQVSQSDSGTSILNEAEAQLNMYKEELDKAEEQLNETKAQLDEAKAEIDDGYAKIAEAEAEVYDFTEDAKCYVFSRSDINPGYASYAEDTERVDNIAKVFPIFFILIAALVCICTMTRMIESQRTEIGTFKALGFGRGAIAAQYIIYAAAASVIGSIVGVCVGLPLIPRVVFGAYEAMYDIPYIITPFKWDYMIGCLIVSMLCTGLSAFIAARAELIANPAKLMRPKPPKSGKRILLERIPFLWKHFSFTQKVTFRNLLRYKSRFFMTVIGIAGCTGLLVAGFGLQYSMSSIVDKQFGEIFRYDLLAAVDTEADEEDKNQLIDLFNSSQTVLSNMGAYQEAKDVYFGEATVEDCYIFAPDNIDNLEKYITLRERKTGNKLTIPNESAIINEKLAKLLGASVGDEIEIIGGAEPVRIAGITENYTNHYVFLSKETCMKLFGENDSNVILINLSRDADKTELSTALLANNSVQAVSFTEDGTKKFHDLIESMNMVVILIICFAGALAFVILFNLVTININERTRELATIKVLGFYDGETSAYIYRENVISTIIGILFGLLLGVLLEKFVLDTAEVESVMFNPEIAPYCFVYAAIITAVFAFIVNFTMHFSLKKIDMATSLKAIE